MTFGNSVCATENLQSLLPFAAEIRMPTWSGAGIYLGRGIFITVAHLVGRGSLTKPRIVIGEHDYATAIVKEGTFETTDLTLLGVEERGLPFRLRIRLNPLCKEPPRPGQKVVTLSTEGITYSQILAPDQLPQEVRKFSTIIADFAHTGNSGSGVFDPERKCLLGIVSRRISFPRTSVRAFYSAKYFVPASEIAEFLPPDLRARF
jgi:hypothetical protein